MKEWIISGVGAIGEQTADDTLRDIERKSRQADSRLSGFNDGNASVSAMF
jgi:hypothetical protein